MDMPRVTMSPDMSFSRIVYGMWRLVDDANTSPTHVQAKIEACLAQGITTLDQADIYGGYMAEEVLGAALKAAPSLKSQLEIVTKCDIVIDAGRHAGARVKHYDTSRDHIEESVDASLRLMGLDRIDLLLIHRPDPMIDPDATGRCLDDLVANGKVRAVGVSNFRPWDMRLLQSRMVTPLATNQIELSLVAHEGFTNGDVSYLHELKMPIMAWSPLGGGSLMAESRPQVTTLLREIASAGGVDAAAVAVAWLLAHPAGILPVMGTNSISRIATLSDALKVSMDRQTWFSLYQAALGHEIA
jgi:predicted oxidoreductase